MWQKWLLRILKEGMNVLDRWWWLGSDFLHRNGWCKGTGVDEFGVYLSTRSNLVSLRESILKFWTLWLSKSGPLGSTFNYLWTPGSDVKSHRYYQRSFTRSSCPPDFFLLTPSEHLSSSVYSTPEDSSLYHSNRRSLRESRVLRVDVQDVNHTLRRCKNIIFGWQTINETQKQGTVFIFILSSLFINILTFYFRDMFMFYRNYRWILNRR